MKRLFFSQSMLDSMVEAGKITVEKGILTMLAAGNPAFRLLPAYRIVRTTGGEEDPNGLTGTIRPEGELKEMGAELYMDSVLYRDTAYQADPGFIAERTVPGETAAEAPPKTQEPPDEDELSKFILENLR